VIDAGESQVLERKLPETIECVVHRYLPFGEAVQECCEGIAIHGIGIFRGAAFKEALFPLKKTWIDDR
jgi:hypothetical protein